MDLRLVASLILAPAPQAAGREGTATGAPSLNAAPTAIRSNLHVRAGSDRPDDSTKIVGIA